MLTVFAHTDSRKGGVRHFLAAYGLETGRVFGQFYAQKTWRAWLTFLKWLRRRYRSGETLTWFWTISGRI